VVPGVCKGYLVMFLQRAVVVDTPPPSSPPCSTGPYLVRLAAEANMLGLIGSWLFPQVLVSAALLAAGHSRHSSLSRGCSHVLCK